MKNRILWISFCAPYDKVAHAGGQIHNFYLKGIQKTGRYDIKLITFAKDDEIEKVDLEDYGINYSLLRKEPPPESKFIWKCYSAINKISPLSRNGGFLRPYISKTLAKEMRSLKNSGYNPNLIILQWTQIILLIDYIKGLYPSIPVISIEEDVTFLKYRRFFEGERNLIKRCYKKGLYHRLHNSELKALNLSEIVILNNNKDLNILKVSNVKSKLWTWVPYFHSYINVNHVGNTKDILFFGAMNRPENWKSAIWFIENVMNKIEDKEVRFIVVGNKPNEALLKYANDRIIITGFVESVEQYFEHCCCLVAPIQSGAGVKIKVIEGISSGIPVLTNSIGIEGIDAQNGLEYFYCEVPKDYIDIIYKIMNGKIDLEKTKSAQKQLISGHYDLNKSLKDYIEIIEGLLK